ncbi:hypothetical protein D3C77_410890 [compost metagenome]
MIFHEVRGCPHKAKNLALFQQLVGLLSSKLFWLRAEVCLGFLYAETLGRNPCGFLRSFPT